MPTFCNQCGANVEGLNFCSSCGAPSVSTVQKEMSPPDYNVQDGVADNVPTDSVPLLGPPAAPLQSNTSQGMSNEQMMLMMQQQQIQQQQMQMQMQMQNQAMMQQQPQQQPQQQVQQTTVVQIGGNNGPPMKRNCCQCCTSPVSYYHRLTIAQRVCRFIGVAIIIGAIILINQAVVWDWF